jgi:hypothetical protein
MLLSGEHVPPCEKPCQPDAFRIARRSHITAAPIVTTPGYLRTLGIPLLQGRDSAETDRESTMRVANDPFSRVATNGFFTRDIRRLSLELEH